MLRFNKKAFKALTFSFILSIIPSIVSAAANTNIAAANANALYVPAPGPLKLGDTYIANPNYIPPTVWSQQPQQPPILIKRGIIMNTVLTDKEFANEIKRFLNFMNVTTVAGLPLYQDIMDSLTISTDSKSVTEIVNILEEAIMKNLHIRQYASYSQGKWSNIFMTGIKYDWFYPSSWISPSSWIYSNVSSEATQLIDELENLTEIVKLHSASTYLRLQAKINSYRSWKRNSIITLGILGALGTGAYMSIK